MMIILVIIMMMIKKNDMDMDTINNSQHSPAPWWMVGGNHIFGTRRCSTLGDAVVEHVQQLNHDSLRISLVAV